jgi:hypothetical protein
MVLETMGARFGSELKIWQFRFDIRNQSPDMPNKIIRKEDREPKRKPSLIVANGPQLNY